MARMTREEERLRLAGPAWKRWGPYLSDRQWGTVREDYSPGGTAWDSFTHDQARSRAYRWGEDGLLGICDDQQRLCLAVALWNGHDPILKERLFGLTNSEGNHGEDVKDYYFFLDNTPTHSYMKALYKYPQRAFPYAELVAENRRRSRQEPEYELIDTGIFAENRYFDIIVEYAKASDNDILMRLTAINRGPEAAELHLIPTLWFRNTWSWDGEHGGPGRPRLRRTNQGQNGHGIQLLAEHGELGSYMLAADGLPELLFTENETNNERLFAAPNPSPYVKDGIDRAIVQGRSEAVNPAGQGSKAAIHYRLLIPAGGTTAVRLRLTATAAVSGDPFADFDTILATRLAEADAFYASLQPAGLSDDERLVQRQAFAGLLWSKQYFHYDVAAWLDGDQTQPSPPTERRWGRNREWRHLHAADIISMPDTWEYPWFAAWDLAFHCIPLALIDADFAKEQLLLLGREWYQHPNGQTPAYEWAFGDVNPPVLAWATWRVYKIDQNRRGQGDRLFLERCFHKLLLNFTWWVNRKDTEGNNVFEGGFLGLDNIGVFDRSAPLPTGGHLHQSDGTAWMGMYCLNLLTIALELAANNRAYEDIAVKLFEHFLSIAEAMNEMVGDGLGLWDEEDEFFYDVLHVGASKSQRVKIRSMVGLIPLYAVTTIEPMLLDQLPEFRQRLEWVLAHRPRQAALVSRWHEAGMGDRRLLALLRGHRMKRVLRRLLDETEFLSPHGIRAVSLYHRDHPYMLHVDGMTFGVAYEPAESSNGLFGGNSNWRGPIWFPVNYLIIEALQQFHHYYGDDFLVECPTGSGQSMTLNEVANELSRRLVAIFLRDADGRRPVFGGQATLQTDQHWRDNLLFYEYFHGDNGAGIGASHQTGWTGLVAKLIQQQGEHRGQATQPRPATARRRSAATTTRRSTTTAKPVASAPREASPGEARHV